jgi:hypothetical protein
MAQFAIDEVLTTGIQISGFIFDYSSSLGTPGQVLACTSSGVMWQADSSNADLSSLSGQIAATGTLLNNRINSLSGYSDATFATITNLAATGSTLDTKINTLSGYSNANFATILNLAATGSVLDTKINTLSGYAGNTFLSGVGVANYVPRWSGTKLLVTGSIYDDGTNVGIGTTVPGALLDVNGLFRFQQDIRVNNGTNKLILSATSTTTELHSAGAVGTIFKGAGNNEIARFDAANFSVGIGTATVSRKLHAYVTTGPVMRLQSSGSNASIEFIPSTIENRYNWLIGAQQNISDAFEITPSTATNGTTFSNPAVLVKSDGNVGIGTNNPSAKLEVFSGNAIIRNDNPGGVASLYIRNWAASPSTQLVFGNSTNDDSSTTLDLNSNVFSITNYGDPGSYIKFGTRNASTAEIRVTIDPSGRVGIGTEIPSTLLSIGGAGSTSAASGITFGADSQANLYRISSSRIKTDGNFTIDGQGGGATSLVLNRSSTSSENGMAFNTAGVTDWYFYVDNGNNNLQIQKSSEIDTAPRVRFDGSNSNILFNLGGGNVGIGVSNPSEKLTITGAVKILTRGGANFKVGDGSNNNTFLEFDYPDISTADAHFRLFRSTNTNGGKYFQIFKGDSSATSQTLLNANGDSHINAVAGNLGIGTDSPTQKLQVSGTVKIQSLGVYSDPTDNAAFLNYDTNGGIFTLSARSDGGNTYMAFRTSNGGTGSEKVRITNNGNVIIGNTTAYAGLTISDVAANDGNDSLAFFYRGTAGAHQSLIRFYDFRGQNNASIGNYLQDDGVGTQKADLIFKTAYNSSPIERMRITNAGSLLIGDTTQTYGPTTLGYMFGVKSQVYQSFISIAKSGQTLDSGGIVLGLDTTTAYLWARENIPISFGTNNNEKFRISADGNLGIGTTNPDTKLHVRGDQVYLYNDLNTNNTYFYARNSSAGNAGIKMKNVDGEWTIIANDRLRFIDDDASLERLSILSNGNIGIGVTNPIEKLTVAGNIQLSGSNNLNFNTNNLGNGNISFDGSTFTIVSNSNAAPLILSTSSFERMRIASDGKVGIGTASPATLLSVGGAGSTAAASGLTFGGDASANLYRISSSRIKTDGSLEAAVGIISPTINSLSGNIAATGSVLDTKINTLSGYSNANFATITNLAATGSVLDTKINTLSGYSNANFATILNLAATGSTLDTKINTTNTNLAATGSTLDTKINTTNTNLAATGSTLNARINSLSGYAGSTFLSGQGVANWTARWNGTKELITGSIYDLGTGVGIGTTSPAYLLDVRSTSIEAVAQFRGINDTTIIIGGNDVGRNGEQYIAYQNADTATAAWMVGMDDGEDFRFAYGAVGEIDDAKTKVKIAQNGNVGIGTTNPTAKLVIMGEDIQNYAKSSVPTAIVADSVPEFLIGSTDNIDGEEITLRMGSVLSSYYTHGAYVKAIQGAGVDRYKLAFGTSNGAAATTKMTIANDGNVGIGITTPLQKLQVDGAVGSPASVGVTQSGIFRISNTTDNAVLDFGIRIAGSGAWIQSTDETSLAANYPLLLNPNGGNVGIGTLVPADKLHVIGNIRINGGDILNWGGQAFIQTIGANDMFFRPNSTLRMILTAVGNLGLGVLAPATLLSVGGEGSTTVASGITFGADAQANLYRSAEDTLRTDGALIAGGYLRALSYVQLVTDLYPGSYTDNLNLNIGNTAGNAWETAIKIKPGSYVGIGTTQPSGKLHVVSSIAGETVLRADGTNGTLFSIVDDLSDSLMSVNNSAGLPVLEVFADDRVVAGQYGSGDFVLINNKIGVGTSNPVNKLSVIGAASIGSNSYNVSAPANGLIVEGSVGIGTTSPSSKLHVYDNGGSFITDLDATYHMGILNEYVSTYVSRTKFGRWNSTSNLELYYDIAGTEEARITRNFAAAVLKFNRGVNTDMIIDGNGNVGIGTTNTTYKLDVNGTSRFANDILSNGNITIAKSSAYLYLNGTNSDSELRFQANGSDRWAVGMNVGDATENLNIYNYTTATTNFTILKTNGNVGIGTASPTNTLQVVGQIAIKGDQSADNVKIHIQASDNSNRYTIKTDLDATTTNDLLIFRSDTVDNMLVLKGNGNVGIGLTNTQHKLQISGGSVAFTSSTGLAVEMLGMTSLNVAYVGPYNTSTDGNAPATVLFNHGASVQQTYFYSSGRIAMVLNKEGRLNIAGNAGNTPPALLNVGPSSSVDAVSGISFGNDASANLYRSAASTIKTDGSLIVAGNVTATNLVSGNGTANFITKWNGTKSIANSQIFDDGTYVGINTAVNTTYRLQVIGSFAATTKSFDITHPTVSGKRLAHASLEGPENGVYYRGQNDNSQINLPHYWSGLVHDDSITVDLTSIGKRKDGKIRGYSVDQIGDNKVYIYTDSDDNIYNYYYTIFAERKDVSKLVIERDME